MTIAACDLQYAAGSILTAKGHPRLWPMSQWAVMVTYELQQSLRDATPNLSWDPVIAEAARHGGKFFDGKGDRNLTAVIRSFESLITANREAFFPPARRFRVLDRLRDDLSVITDGDEVLLTSVGGQFMLGFPPSQLVNFSAWGPHALTLMQGVGQAAGLVFPDRRLEEFAAHGNHSDTSVTWWDGKLSEVIPATFAGELSAELALALITIHSTVQAACKWASTDCCPWCAAAALKHRFVVLHHAARSVEQLHSQIDQIGERSADHLDALWADPDVKLVTTLPYRRLRNGWFHLGLGDIEARLPTEPDVLSVIEAYTHEATEPFARLVNDALTTLARELGLWMGAPAKGGGTMFDRLHKVTL